MLAFLLWSGLAFAQEGLTPPRLIRFVDAELPAGTLSRDVDVRVLITIGEDGKVSKVELDGGAGEPWDSATVAAVKAFGFEPARQDGETVPVQVPYVYRFHSKRRGRFVASRRDRRPLHPTPGYRLAGEVLEKGTRTPLGAITVVLTDPSTGNKVETTTGADGRFTAYGLAPGEVQLRIVTGEHAPIERKTRGVPGDPDSSPIEPSVRVYLDPVGVSQYRTVVKDKPKPKTATEISLTEDELTKMPGTFGDPTRVVAALPGVARSPFGLGYYVVRGAAFENTGFFIDDHPALFLYHLLGGPGIIHPELVGRITFFPGGYPVDFGRFATGAIVLETKDPPDDRWHLDVSMDLFKASLLFSVPFDDGRGLVTASLRRSYYDLILPLIDDSVDLSYTDYQLRVTYDVSPAVRTKLLLLGAEDRFSSSGPPPAGASTEESDSTLSLGFHRILAGVEWDVSKKVTWESSLVWEYDHTSSRRASTDDDPIDIGIGGWILSARSGVTWTPLEGLEVRAGLDGVGGTFDVELRLPSFPPIGDPRPPIFDPIIVGAQIDDQIASVSPYLNLDWDVGGGVRLIPGVRGTMDYYGDGPEYTADPRMALRWQVHDQWTITAMGAIANQQPAPFQVSDPLGDPTIPPVRGHQVSLGLEWEPGDGWDIKVEGFFNYIDNMSRPSDAVVSDQGSVDRAYWTPDMEARAWGAELLVRKRFGGRYYGWLSYTLSRAERLLPPLDWELYNLDQTHILNLAWSVLLGADWSAGARFQLASGNPFYPIVGSRYDADRDRYEPIYSTARGRLPLYHRLDIRIDKRWRFDTWMLEFYLDIQNVYNSPNPELPQYSYDYSQKFDGPGIPILPTFGFRAVF